jgi:FkbM family methyltransferase
MQVLYRLVRGDPSLEFSDQGNRYWISRDSSTVYALLNSLERLRRLAGFVEPTDQVVIDVGAHSGLFSAFAAERAPGAKFILIEPDRELEPTIRANLRQRANWQLVQKAVAEHSGRRSFFRNPTSTQTSSLFVQAASEFGATVEETVDTVSLDDLCAEIESIDVLKVDVQGAEGLAVQGATLTLPKVRTLLIEITLLDPQPELVLTALRAQFPHVERVNAVYMGADLAFRRDSADVR